MLQMFITETCNLIHAFQPGWGCFSVTKAEYFIASTLGVQSVLWGTPPCSNLKEIINSHLQRYLSAMRRQCPKVETLLPKIATTRKLRTGNEFWKQGSCGGAEVTSSAKQASCTQDDVHTAIPHNNIRTIAWCWVLLSVKIWPEQNSRMKKART